MSGYNYRKKRYKIKYKNLALLLAIFLLVVLLIGKGCSAIFSKKDKPNPDRDNPSSSGDQKQDSPPNEDGVTLTDDPTLQTSYFFQSVQCTDADLGIGNLVLVNNKIEFKGTVNVEDLDVVREKKNSAYSVKDYTVLVQPVVMDALNDMLLDFYNATGNDGVMVRAGHRTYEYQQGLYDDELKKTGQASSALVAMPGYSEHHTGLAVDFTTYRNGVYKDFDGTGDYAWIMDNCYKYGFVNRYPEGKQSLTMIDNEPWHFRYVGVPHATAMKNYDLCLEEYISFLKNYTVKNGFLSVTTDDGSQYIIIYTPKSNGDATSVYLPQIDRDTKQLYPYEISGNNVDGWIVTFLYKQGTGVALPAVPDVDDTVPANNDEPENAEGDAQ